METLCGQENPWAQMKAWSAHVRHAVGQLRIIAKRPMATIAPMLPEAATPPHVPSFGLSQ